MKKLSITSVLALAIICPVFANVDIDADANSADCTNDILHTYSAPTSLEADWNANTIHLNWYLDSDATQPLSTGIQTSAQTCIYDGSITLPTTNPTKTGYTFAGWQVRGAAPQQTPVALSSLYESGTINVLASKSLNPGAYCKGYLNNEDWSESGQDCNDSRFNGLNDGEWRVTMPNGNTVKGVATCSTQSGDTHNSQWGGNSTDWSLASTALTAGQYSTDANTGLGNCWCKIISADTGNGYQSVASSSWVLLEPNFIVSSCAQYCAHECADAVRGNNNFRVAVFGTTGASE